MAAFGQSVVALEVRGWPTVASRIHAKDIARLALIYRFERATTANGPGSTGAKEASRDWPGSRVHC
jgi:hypothetical protein